MKAFFSDIIDALGFVALRTLLSATSDSDSPNLVRLSSLD
jgi:hypothetical protein